jgi:CXXC-20-CXXC protein
MKTCKNCTAKFNLKKVLISYWKGYEAIKCTNCDLSFKHDVKNRFLGGANIGIGTFIAGIVMFNLNTTLAYKLLFGIMTSLLCTLLLTSVIINLFSFIEEDS